MFDATFIEHLLLSSFLTKCCIKGERLDLAKTVINLQKEVKKKNSCFKSNNKKSLLWNVKTDVNYNKVLLIHGGGICGWVVNTSNSTSAGPGFKPRPLHCFLRQGTLLHFVSLHPGVSWVPVTYCWGGTLWWTSILSRIGGEKQRKERSNDQFKANPHGNFPGPLLFCYSSALLWLDLMHLSLNVI